jgi:hypothetical protein
MLATDQVSRVAHILSYADTACHAVVSVSMSTTHGFISTYLVIKGQVEKSPIGVPEEVIFVENRQGSPSHPGQMPQLGQTPDI